jgi:hypothetical protein
MEPTQNLKNGRQSRALIAAFMLYRNGFKVRHLWLRAVLARLRCGRTAGRTAMTKLRIVISRIWHFVTENGLHVLTDGQIQNPSAQS